MSRRMFTFTTVLVLAIGGLARAQQHTYGIKGGLNLAWIPAFNSVNALYPDDPVSSSSLAGASVGVFFTLPLAGAVELEPEAMITRKGARMVDGYSDPARLSITYLELPLLVRVAPGASGRHRPYGFAGPFFGLRMSASLEAYGDSGDFTENTRGTEFGVAFGGGVDAGRWLVEGRFTQGFTSFATDEATASGEPSAPNRVFSVLAGVRF